MFNTVVQTLTWGSHPHPSVPVLIGNLSACRRFDDEGDTEREESKKSNRWGRGEKKTQTGLKMWGERRMEKLRLESSVINAAKWLTQQDQNDNWQKSLEGEQTMWWGITSEPQVRSELNSWFDCNINTLSIYLSMMWICMIWVMLNAAHTVMTAV